MKITILGAGNLGGALARGFVRSGKVAPADITLTASRDSTLAAYRAEGFVTMLCGENDRAAKDADYIIIAVKPWLVESVLLSLCRQGFKENQVVVSAAAGLDWEVLRTSVESHNLAFPSEMFSVIPNTASAGCAGMTFIAPLADSGHRASDVESLFSLVGATLVTDMPHLSAGTMLSSCGIAYALRYLRAATEGGVQLGFKAEDALRIVCATMKGAISLLENNHSHPEQEIDKVTTPGGMTIKGLNAMEEAGFTSAVIKGLTANTH